MRIWTYIVIMGIGFTFGLLCGLLIHLPADTLPAAQLREGAHHLGRMRRAAQVDSSSDMRENTYQHDKGVNLDSTLTSNAGRILVGSANKQIFKSESVKADYPSIAVKDPVDNPLKPRHNTPYIGIFDKSETNHSRSVVYVNSEVQKLVLDNKVNKPNHTDRTNSPRGLYQQLDNRVVSGETADIGQPKNEDVSPVQHGQLNTASDRFNKNTLIKEGIFWGSGVVNSCPKGFSEAEYNNWKSRSKMGKFVKMETGCGRMQNRMLHFVDSQKACARYRLNIDQIQGEIYSFYLSKLLDINNVVPSTLHLADSNLDLWRMVSKDVANAQWSEEKPLIISQWISDLTPAYIPIEFRNLSKIVHGKDVLNRISSDTINPNFISTSAVTSLCELFQWSDLIVFDYLTGNLDRVVNNLFNLQWNDRMMSKPAHNLERDSRGSLVFIDNESGLFHGYRLLEKYSKYHESLLSALCVFNEQTISKIRDFVKNDNIGEALQTIFEQSEPLHRHVPRIPVKNIKILKQRMLDVLRQVDKCSLS